MTNDEAARVRQSACETTGPDRLLELAHDPSVTVRVSLALNPALPPAVCAVLAQDTDARVRGILDRKLARLTPDMSDDTRERVHNDALASLTAMVADAALRVRTSIAEAVRELPDGPREIVLHLAHDPAVMVCEPIIRFSPMLTQEDLLALIASGPPPTTFAAVAQRKGIGSSVADAIVGTADIAAISALLSNHTAQIREATLDALAAQSEEHTGWQEPLINRPHLPPRAQRLLAEIVTGHLLEALAARKDLDPKVSAELSKVLAPAPAAVWGKAVVPMTPHTALMQARALNKVGKLDDQAVLGALKQSETMAAIAMVSILANMAIPAIERACSLRSAKAVVSLAWAAGLTMQTAMALQATIGTIPPDEILRPVQGTRFPLSDDEMRWQLAFLGSAERGVGRA